MRQRRLRKVFRESFGVPFGEPFGVPIRRCFAVILAAAALAGCMEDSAAPEQATAVPRGSADAAAAMYGVNAQVSYPGDSSGLADTAMVYVFLRKPGTRMPLAVRHFPASELPKRVSFAGAAQQDDLELVARLSPGGQVDRSPEDIEVIQAVHGFQHPPQNYAMVLGATPGKGSPGPAQVTKEGGDAAPVNPASESREVAIRAEVVIDAGHSFPANTVVFVIARKPGQAMPSAVKRFSVADLPARIELTDTDAMTFSNRLSDAEHLDLFARISTSGTATQSSADWVSDTVRLETARLPELVTLTIGPPPA